MTTLENLYNGNIEPTDSESLKNNVRYKEGLRLVSRLHDELSATLNEEQKELFENISRQRMNYPSSLTKKPSKQATDWQRKL